MTSLGTDDVLDGGKGDAPRRGEEPARTRWRFASAVEAARHLGFASR
jgi:hypothetical protein